MPNLTTVALTMALASYLVCCILFVAHFFNNKLHFYRTARIFSIIAFIAITLAIVLRTIEVGRLPLSNMFEFTLSFIWGMSLAFLVVEIKFRPRGLGVFFTPLTTFMVIWLLTMDQSSGPLMPALRSNWLYIHVFTAILSYGAFAVSFVVALMYLLKEQRIWHQRLPRLELLDDLIYKIISFAMPFLTLLIVSGAIWAEDAWGSYWSWDPKETWSLITWLIYAAYLHARFIGGWKGRKSAIFAIIGFMAVMFTFVGVSYLLPGQHSYI